MASSNRRSSFDWANNLYIIGKVDQCPYCKSDRSETLSDIELFKGFGINVIELRKQVQCQQCRRTFIRVDKNRFSHYETTNNDDFAFWNKHGRRVEKFVFTVKLIALMLVASVAIYYLFIIEFLRNLGDFLRKWIL